jgi:NAD(P)-dependent dehydrogenase (short-subunit alcohol dehydrogenase family)
MKEKLLTEEDMKKISREDDNFKIDSSKRLLEDKVVIITGCSSGLGLATTKTFLEAGAKVVGCYSPEADKRLYPDAIEELKEFAKDGNFCKNLIYKPWDISYKSTPKKLVDIAISKFKKIDVLCNFAGFAYFTPFGEITRKEYNKTLEVNLNGHVFLSQRVSEEMKKNKLLHKNASRGSIINMTSIIGVHLGEDGVVPYGVTKGGLLGLTKELVTELGPYGIRVNQISPGSVLTPIQIRDYKNKSRSIQIERKTALMRWGFPREVANAALFLASDLSTYVTGTEILLDGGITSKFQLY